MVFRDPLQLNIKFRSAAKTDQRTNKPIIRLIDFIVRQVQQSIQDMFSLECGRWIVLGELIVGRSDAEKRVGPACGDLVCSCHFVWVAEDWLHQTEGAGEEEAKHAAVGVGYFGGSYVD